MEITSTIFGYHTLANNTLIQLRNSIILPDLRNSGFVLAEKGHLDPTQQPKFYGMILNTVTGIVSAPESKINTTIQALKNLLSEKRITARHLSSVKGKIMSLSQAFVHAKVRCLELYAIINAENRKPWEWNNSVHLTKQALTDIAWVQENLKKKNGRLGWKPSQIISIYVDASTIGWSATLGQERAFGNWPHKHKHTDIAILESMAVLLGLESFISMIAHHWITIFIDNQVARKQ